MKVNTVCMSLEDYDNMNIHINSLGREIKESRELKCKLENLILDSMEAKIADGKTGDWEMVIYIKELCVALNLDYEKIKKQISHNRNVGYQE